jgi:hypothetical protein
MVVNFTKLGFQKVMTKVTRPRQIMLARHLRMFHSVLGIFV